MYVCLTCFYLFLNRYDFERVEIKMTTMNHPTYLSLPHMGKEFIAKAFENNWIAPVGPNIDKSEQELAGYVNAQGAVALSSGTAALHIALQLLGAEEGDNYLISKIVLWSGNTC
jgi:pyridoxal phosphate-dependent aminotransferase EpsN